MNFRKKKRQFESESHAVTEHSFLSLMRTARHNKNTDKHHIFFLSPFPKYKTWHMNSCNNTAAQFACSPSCCQRDLEAQQLVKSKNNLAQKNMVCEYENHLPGTNCWGVRWGESPDCGAAQEMPFPDLRKLYLQESLQGSKRCWWCFRLNYLIYLTLLKVERVALFHSIWPLDAYGRLWNHNSVIASLCPRFNFL